MSMTATPTPWPELPAARTAVAPVTCGKTLTGAGGGGGGVPLPIAIAVSTVASWVTAYDAVSWEISTLLRLASTPLTSGSSRETEPTPPFSAMLALTAACAAAALPACTMTGDRVTRTGAARAGNVTAPATTAAVRLARRQVRPCCTVRMTYPLTGPLGSTPIKPTTSARLGTPFGGRAGKFEVFELSSLTGLVRPDHA